jgi:hypothetical protein
MAVMMSIYKIIKFRAISVDKNPLWPMEYARVPILGHLMGFMGRLPLWGRDRAKGLNKGNGITLTVI